jgi:hypothetical protein
MQASLDTRTLINEKVSQREITPTAGIFFSEYIAALDRIVRHSRNIALSEQQPQFWIKRSKLERHMDMAPEAAIQPLIDPKDFLARIQDEDES